METIRIREAVKNDVATMVELWKEMMDFHKERDKLFTRKDIGHKGWIEFVTDHMSKEDSCVFVAELDGQIVGHCLGFLSDYPPVITIERYGKFQELAVMADYRRCGVGKELVKKMLIWFSEQGMKRIEVNVSVHNELSTAFWRKIGFSPYLETLYRQI